MSSKELRTIFRHSRIYSLASILNRGASFILIPLYAHYMPPAEYGALNLITTASELVGTMLGMGLGMAMSRIFFDYPGERERAEVVTTVIIGSCAIFAVFTVPLLIFAEPLAYYLLGEPGQGSLLALGMSGLLLNSVFTLGLQNLRVRQRSTAFLVASTLRSVLYLGLSSLLVAGLSWGAQGALTGILIANGLMTLGTVLPLVMRLRPRFSPKVFRAALYFALPLLPGSVAEFVLLFADRSISAKLLGLGAAGIYFLGARIGKLLYALLIDPFNQIYVTRRLEAHGAGSDDPDAPRIFTYFFLLLVTVALALSLLAPEAMRIIAGPDYAAAARLFPLICLAQVEISLIIIVQMGIFFRKASRHIMTASVAMLVVHIPLTIVLILNMGIQGAALAACLSSAFKVAVSVYLGRRLGGPRTEWLRIFVILVAAAGAFGAGSLAEGMLPWWLGLAVRLVLLAAFPVALFLSPLFTREERGDLAGLILPSRSRRGLPPDLDSSPLPEASTEPEEEA
jgi:O-antigen/teichoic acid export membrane protein